MFINSALIAIPPTFSNLRHLRLLAMVHSPIRACLRKGSAADFQHPTCCLCVIIWLVVLTILKNISQWEGLSHILWKIKMFETTNQLCVYSLNSSHLKRLLFHADVRWTAYAWGRGGLRLHTPGQETWEMRKQSQSMSVPISGGGKSLTPLLVSSSWDKKCSVPNSMLGWDKPTPGVLQAFVWLTANWSKNWLLESSANFGL